MKHGEAVSGEIVGADFADGTVSGCDCPQRDGCLPPRAAGTYVIVRLDRDVPVGKFTVQIKRVAR